MHTGGSAVPVVVVGAGPVGQSAALLLARWGIDVVVLDARPARDLIGSKALCQQRDVLDIWDSVGVGRQVADEGVTWTTSRTYYRDQQLFCVEFVDRGRSPFPPWVNVSQSRTEALLDERIAAEPRIDVRWGHAVRDLTQDADGVTLQVATPAGPRQLRAQWVLAATGVKDDGLRAALGLTFAGRSFSDRFLICDIRADLPGWERERRFYFDPEWNRGRQVLIHPCPDSTFRIDWQVPADYDLADDAASGSLDRRIRAIVGGRDYEVVWQSAYRFHSRHVERMRVGRVLLAGDVAHVVAPFGARGLNGGVQDAENAAWKLAFVLHGWAPETLLDSYDAERLAAALENLDVTTATMRFLVPQDDDERATRLSVLERARTDPSARPLVNSGRMAEPFWYVDSPLTTTSPQHDRASRPPVGQSPVPGPGVLLPDLEVQRPSGPGRIRSLARQGLLALVAAGSDPVAVVEVLAAQPVPATVVELGVVDAGGDVARALGVLPGEVWLVRPDAHVAAVVPAGNARDVQAAVDRTLGRDARQTTASDAEETDALLPQRR